MHESFFVYEVEEISGGDGGSAVGSGGAELPRFFAIGSAGTLEDSGIIEGVDAVFEEDGAHGRALHLVILPSGFWFLTCLSGFEGGGAFCWDEEQGFGCGERGHGGSAAFKGPLCFAGIGVDEGDAGVGHEGDASVEGDGRGPVGHFWAIEFPPVRAIGWVESDGEGFAIIFDGEHDGIPCEDEGRGHS